MNTLRVETIIEVVCAAHLASYVESPFQHRGGLWLVGPPGQLKSSLIEPVDSYQDVVTLSDVNTKTLMQLKGELSTGSIRTLVIPEMQKLYERDPRSALNVEGAMRALVEEGYRGASFEDSSINRFRARACVIGAMNEETQTDHWERWKTGFARRFLWCLVRLQDSEILLDAIQKWKLAEIGVGIIPKAPTPRTIPNLITEPERIKIRQLIKYQPKPAVIPYELLCKIAAVLKWHYQRAGLARKAMETVTEFSACLGKEGAEIIIDPNWEGKKKRNQYVKKLRRRNGNEIGRRRERSSERNRSTAQEDVGGGDGQGDEGSSRGLEESVHH